MSPTPQHTTPAPTTHLSFTTVEAALGSLSRRVFGLDLVIEPAADAPAAPAAESPLGETCPRCRGSNTSLLNYGVAGRPDWMCHGCATKENQRLGRIDTALLRLLGVKEVTSLDAAEALGQAGAVIADKEAVIRRLKEKLEVTEEVMQDNTSLRAERDNWAETAAHHLTEVKRLTKRLNDQEDYIEKEHIAAWGKIQKAIPPQEPESELSLCDYVIEQLKAKEDSRVRPLVEKLERIEKATLHLRGFKEISSHDPSGVIEQAAMLVQKKDQEKQLLTIQHERQQKSLFAYGEFTRDIATALGMVTHEISFKDVMEKIKWLGEGRIAKVVHDIQVAALVSHRDQLQKERDAFKAIAEGLTKKPAPVPEYRLLDEGEILQEGDEFQGPFGWVLTRYRDQGVQPGWGGYYRRKIVPA